MIVPDRVEWVHQHEAVQCFGGNCVQKKVDPNIAVVNHYRIKLKSRHENITIPDFKVWKIKERLLRNVEKTLFETKFTP